MPTVTFDLASDADDGDGTKSNIVFANVPGSSYTVGDGTEGGTVRSLFGGSYFIGCCYFRFDTSSLPNDATVTAANLKLYLNSKGDPDNLDYAGDFYDFGGEPSVDADWEATSSGDAITTIDATGQTAGVVNTIALTTLTGVSLTGFTGLRLSSKTNPTPTGDNFLTYAMHEDATSGRRPQLEVTYTTPTVGAAVAWIVA